MPLPNIEHQAYKNVMQKLEIIILKRIIIHHLPLEMQNHRDH